MLLNLFPTSAKNIYLFANCPSDIDIQLRSSPSKKPSTIATLELDSADCYQELTYFGSSLTSALKETSLFTLSLRVRLVLASLKQLPGWHNLLQDRVQHIGFLQNLGLTFCPKSNQEKLLIACQVEPNAEHCLIIWTQSCKTLEYVFPRQTVQNCETVKELQNLSVVNSIDFRKQNGCHRISDKIDVTSLTVELANDSLVDIELVEKSIQPTIEAAWAHGLAECQVIFFPWDDTSFREHCPHGITMSVLDLKNFTDVKLKEVLMQLASLKIRYHFMAYKRLAIVGPAALVIDLHIALLPVDVHLPIGPKQGAFTIHMTRSLPGTMESLNDGHHLQAKFGKIGTFRYVPAQIIWREIHPSICSEDQIVQSPLADQFEPASWCCQFFTALVSS